MTDQRIPVADRPKKPANLGLAGTRLWREIAHFYLLRPDEVRILEDAAREADLIDDLGSALAGAPRLIKGSQGQMVINPMISEVRQHRSVLASLLKQLKIPDVDRAAGQDTRSTQARAAAQSRWQKRWST